MPLHHAKAYVEHLKSKPEHVRRQYALAISGGATLLIALAWITALGSSGSLALKPQTDTNTRALATDNQGSGFSSLVGAAAAFRSGFSDSSLQVVETQTTSSLDRPEDKTQDATVIPF